MTFDEAKEDLMRLTLAMHALRDVERDLNRTPGSCPRTIYERADALRLDVEELQEQADRRVRRMSRDGRKSAAKAAGQ